MRRGTKDVHRHVLRASLKVSSCKLTHLKKT